MKKEQKKAFNDEYSKKVNIKVENQYNRLRIKINGIIHLSIPYGSDNFNLIIHSYFTGKNFFNIDYHIDGQIIETGYTRKDVFESILSELEKQNII